MEWTPIERLTLSQITRQESAINAALTTFRHSRGPGWALMMRKRAMALRAARRKLMIDSLEIDYPISEIDWYRYNN